MRSIFLVAAALLASSAASVQAQSVSAGIEAWQRADYAGAVGIWRPLAEKGDPDAEFNLGQAYRLGRGVEPNISAAKTWFERAANQGHLDAETTLGLLLFQNGDQAGGLKWLSKAADEGEPRAMLVYGTALFNGDGVPQDPVRGYAYVSVAAAQGLAPARKTLDQLDTLLPPADRKRGLAIARDLPKAPSTKASAKSEQATASTAPKPSGKAKPKLKEVAAAPKPEEAKPEQPPAAKLAAKRAAVPKGTVAASGDWRIQLGAFSNRRNAESLYGKLSGKAALAGRTPFYVSAGTVTRLQIGPFETSAAAAAACKALGVPCFPVRAK